MKVLITGASGFLGQYLVKHLMSTHDVFTLSSKAGNDFVLDIVEQIPLLPQFDLVVHAAGKAHSIPLNIDDSNDFFKVNVEGTKNLLKGLELNKPKQLIFISSVSVYGLDQGILINENHPLLGSTPYARSKILAEKLVLNWGLHHNVKIIVFRLPLIVGINPPGNLGKMIYGIKKGLYFTIGEGKSMKSMVLADNLCQFINSFNLNFSGVFNLTDGYHPTFNEIEKLLCSQLNKPKPFRLPKNLSKLIGVIGDYLPFFPLNSKTLDKILHDLTFDDSKAISEINWKPLSVLENFKLSSY